LSGGVLKHAAVSHQGHQSALILGWLAASPVRVPTQAFLISDGNTYFMIIRWHLFQSFSRIWLSLECLFWLLHPMSSSTETVDTNMTSSLITMNHQEH